MNISSNQSDINNFYNNVFNTHITTENIKGYFLFEITYDNVLWVIIKIFEEENYLPKVLISIINEYMKDNITVNYIISVEINSVIKEYTIIYLCNDYVYGSILEFSFTQKFFITNGVCKIKNFTQSEELTKINYIQDIISIQNNYVPWSNSDYYDFMCYYMDIKKYGKSLEHKLNKFFYRSVYIEYKKYTNVYIYKIKHSISTKYPEIFPITVRIVTNETHLLVTAKIIDLLKFNTSICIGKEYKRYICNNIIHDD